MRKFLLSLTLLIVSISAWALSPYDKWKDEIIRKGQKQLLQLQKENAINDAAGRSGENSYLVIVSPGYPNAEYITQRKGIGRGADAQYLLDQTTLTNLDGTLRTMNSTSDIDTYVLIVHFMPMEFVNEIPDDQTIRGFFAGNKREIVSAIAQPISDEAASIVTGITSEPLGKVSKPTLYCGFVNFRAFKNDKEGISQWVYYPNNSQINFDEQYKKLLNRLIKKTSFPQEEVAKVVTLIDAIQKNNAEYKRLKGSLEAILKITDPDQMADLVHNAGNTGIAAFDLRQRVHALKVLSSARLNEGRETQVSNLLITAPTRDYEPLLDSLMTSNKFSSEREALLKCIVGRTDDEHLLWGDDNYLQLVKTIGHLVKNSSGIDAKTGAYIGDPENNRTLVWDKSYALNFFINAPIGTNAYDVDLMDNGYIHVKYKYVTDWKCETRTQAKSEISYEACQEIWSKEDEFVVNPFDLIGFINRSDLAILNGVGDKDAKVIVVPALMLKYAQDKKFNANAAAGFFMTLDAVTILVPMTKVYNLAKITQRIYLGLDLAAAAGSIGNLTVNMLNNDPAFASVVQKYNLIMAAVNIASLAGGTKLAANLAGEFVGEVNKPGVKEALQQLAVKGNKNADEILALEKELELEGRVAGLSWVNGAAKVSALQKLVSKAASLDIPWKNLDSKYVVWVNATDNTLHTAKTFASETGSSLYDIVLDGGYYVKFDLNDGRILLGDATGNYHAFAIVENTGLSTFKTSILNASDDVFNTKLAEFLTDHAGKLKVLSGVTPKTLTIAGSTVTTSASKVNTILGRFRPDIKALFSELGSYKNIGLGEAPGGINLLNKPDFYYDANTWWSAYNKPWLNSAIARGDDIYLATIPQKAEDLVDASGNLKGAYAQEVDFLVSKNYKPKNITEPAWTALKAWLNKWDDFDIPGALNHVKFRDLTNLSRRDIVGMHDAVEFAKLRATKAIGNTSYQVAIGKTLDEVEEIVILVEKSHDKIPGVKIVEYRVPATNGKLSQRINGVDVNKGYTTGTTRGEKSIQNYIKTIYDPVIWTDERLVKALREALIDAINKNNGILPTANPSPGLTSDGYKILFTTNKGKVTSFWFD